MEFKNKKFMIIGFARSGVAAAKVLSDLDAEIYINDMKNEELLTENIKALEGYDVKFILGKMPDDYINGLDYLILSPGVPANLPAVKKAQEIGVEILGEVELAYRLCKSKNLIAITGTNGKTTTTSLVGNMFIDAGYKTHIVGNIGDAFIGKVTEIEEDDVVVAEISSYQMETAKLFHPYISTILNVTPDHLKRHGTMENYIYHKEKVYANTTKDDFIILNADNDITAAIKPKSEAKLFYFSRKKTLGTGAYLKDDKLVYDFGEGQKTVCHKSEVFIQGDHNIENALAAVSIGALYGLTPEDMKNTLKAYKGFPHRQEIVTSVNDIVFINDSKATNPEASIPALNSLTKPTVIIAGGMDKGNDFDEFIKAFKDKVKYMVVLGETADELIKTAGRLGFENIVRVATLEEAVEKSYELAQPGWSVLLSPACASWDMFKDFEQRGDLFKEYVYRLKAEV